MPRAVQRQQLRTGCKDLWAVSMYHLPAFLIRCTSVSTDKLCRQMSRGCLQPPNWQLSTVLAQDHFFSDSLSLHLTSKIHKDTMMMLLGMDSKTSTSACSADLMKVGSQPLSEWHFRELFDGPGHTLAQVVTRIHAD